MKWVGLLLLAGGVIGAAIAASAGEWVRLPYLVVVVGSGALVAWGASLNQWQRWVAVAILVLLLAAAFFS